MLPSQSLSGYEQYFAMARGVPGIEALDMSKFFDTNYHYLVPELTSSVSPKPDFGIFLDKIKRGQAAIGKEKAVPIIIGEPGSRPSHGYLRNALSRLRSPSCRHGCQTM